MGLGGMVGIIGEDGIGGLADGKGVSGIGLPWPTLTASANSLPALSAPSPNMLFYRDGTLGQEFTCSSNLRGLGAGEHVINQGVLDTILADVADSRVLHETLNERRVGIDTLDPQSLAGGSEAAKQELIVNSYGELGHALRPRWR